MIHFITFYLKPEKGGLKLLKTLDLHMRTLQKKRNIRLRLDFPQSATRPTIKSITLNYKTICTGISGMYITIILGLNRLNKNLQLLK